MPEIITCMHLYMPPVRQAELDCSQDACATHAGGLCGHQVMAVLLYTGIVGVEAPKTGGGSADAVADMLVQLKTAIS